MSFIKSKPLFLVAILLIFSLIIPTQAESPIEKAKAVKQQIAGMRGDLSKAFEAYKENEAKLQKLNNKVANNQVKLQKTTIALKKNQKILGRRVNNMYRYDQVSYFDIIFSARTFNEFLVNMDFLLRISHKDARIISKVKKLKRQIAITQKRLVTDRDAQKKVVKKLKQKKDYIDSKLAKAKKMLKGLEKQIAELAKPKPIPPQIQQQISSPTAPPAAVNGQYAFPSGAPYSFSNDWGAPRRGHTHQGNDILAPMGTPAYAVIGGTVGSSYGGSAGLWITLNGDDGNAYWYMHMQNVTASGRVSTGQQIGTVGNTGNAAGGPAHIHFELHPGGGGAVNPYYFLTSIQ